MKKIFLIALILIVSISALAMRPVKRISFPKGATKVAVTGYLNGYKDSQIYLIKLRAGQRMEIKANRYVSLYLTDPDGEDASDMDLSCHSRQVVENTKAGDYKIKAVECGKADAWKGSFKLDVTVKSVLEPVPSDEELQSLVQTTIQDFADAVEAEDFAEFYKTLSASFRRQFTLKKVYDTFKVFIDIKDRAVPGFRNTRELTPAYLPLPKTGLESGYKILSVKGKYESDDVLKFNFKYLKESDKWKIIALHFDFNK